ALLEQSCAYLGTLQVLEDADGASLALGGAAQALYVVGVIFVRAVGEVQASDVHAEAEQVAHGGFGRARRTDGADDFGATGDGSVLGKGLLRLWMARFQILLDRFF